MSCQACLLQQAEIDRLRSELSRVRGIAMRAAGLLDNRAECINRIRAAVENALPSIDVMNGDHIVDELGSGL